MNWVQKNPFLTGYLAVTVIGAGALGYLLFSAHSNYTQVSENYDAQVARLQQLQNRTPFPSAENNAAYEKLTKEYQAKFEELQADVAKMQLPLEQISPQAFQDRLRAVVSEVEQKAEQNGVTLPDGFYMGFDKYQATPPSDQAAAPLLRQLGGIKKVVDALLDVKVSSIVSISRPPLPEESGTTSEPTPEPARRSTSGRRDAGAAPATDVVKSSSFDIVFEADQPRTRQALNSIVGSDTLFVIRNLTITNSAQEGPSRVAPAEEQQSTQSASAADAALAALLGGGGETTDAAATSSEAPPMRMLVGNETLTVATRIEMVTITTPEPKQ